MYPSLPPLLIKISLEAASHPSSLYFISRNAWHLALNLPPKPWQGQAPDCLPTLNRTHRLTPAFPYKPNCNEMRPTSASQSPQTERKGQHSSSMETAGVHILGATFRELVLNCSCAQPLGEGKRADRHSPSSVFGNSRNSEEGACEKQRLRVMKLDFQFRGCLGSWVGPHYCKDVGDAGEACLVEANRI